MNAIKQMFSK